MRVFNRMLALVLGLVLVGGGVLVVIEAAWSWTGSGFEWIPGRQWLATFKSTSWSASIVIGVSVAVAALGLVLVVLEARPQRKRHAAFQAAAGDWLLLRRSTEAHLQRRISKQVPTTPIKVRLTPRSLRWRLKVTAAAASTTKPELQAVARSELARLRAPGAAKVEVVTTGSRRPM
jgi:hypothetical protein